MLPVLHSKLKTAAFFLLLLLPSAISVKLSEECKTVIRYALEAWVKNPESFPYRVHGAFFGSHQRDRRMIPDIIIWDPLTQLQMDLERPSCDEPRTLLRAVRWKDEQTYYDQPRICFAFKGKSF